MCLDITVSPCHNLFPWYYFHRVFIDKELVMNSLIRLILCFLFVNFTAVVYAGEVRQVKKLKHGSRFVSEAKKARPMGKVSPRIGENYKAGLFSFKSTLERIEAYKACMFPEEGRLERALLLSSKMRMSDDLRGGPDLLAHEVCFADAIGLGTGFDAARMGGIKPRRQEACLFNP